MALDWTQSTRTLKAVVIVLGVMIVAGAVVIAVELVRRMGNMPGAPAERYAEATVALPAGARALSVTGDGEAVSLLVEGPDGQQQLLTIDRRSGEILGTLVLQPGQ